MLAKMGICVLLCGLALLSKQFGGQLAKTSAMADREKMGGDYLGKLRFVELPGMIDVFSSENRFKLGIDNDGYEIKEDGTILTVYGGEGAVMACPAQGSIRSICSGGSSSAVEVSAAEDMVISYGNVKDIRVEEGQPVKAGDTLFTCNDPLEVRIYKGGRPCNPAEYFDLTGMLPA